MTSLPEGVQIYLLTSIVVALLIHWRFRRYVIGSGITAILGFTAFALICVLDGEAISLTEPSVVLFFTAISLVVGVVIGLPFVLWRRISRAQQGA